MCVVGCRGPPLLRPGGNWRPALEPAARPNWRALKAALVSTLRPPLGTWGTADAFQHSRGRRRVGRRVACSRAFSPRPNTHRVVGARRAVEARMVGNSGALHTQLEAKNAPEKEKSGVFLRRVFPRPHFFPFSSRRAVPNRPTMPALSRPPSTRAPARRVTVAAAAPRGQQQVRLG